MTGAQGKMPAPGPVGRNLIANVERLLRDRRLSYRKLSAELEKTGRPVPPLGLSRMARGERRVDVDEATALAGVLRVPLHVLLSPPDPREDSPGKIPAALREARNLAARIEDLLAASGDAEASRASSGYLARALRRVQIEVEELLEETAAGWSGKA